MKIIEFTYTKPNGDVSQRVAVELAKPNKHMVALDLGELDDTQIGEFAAKYNELMLELEEKRQALYAEFDLKHRLRMFDPEKMTNVTAEFI